MLYVTMTDKFLSGWGLAEGKTSKFVIECETYAQAQEVAASAKKDKYLTRVNICSNRPKYPSSRYHTSIKTYQECTAFHD